MEPDFKGYASKANVRCNDGLTIMQGAFDHQDKVRVPLVWQHDHSGPSNVLGHAILEKREDGVYCSGYFNNTPQGLNSKNLVAHGDVDSLSIWADKLLVKSKQIFHGMIRELSLCLSGQNPEAKIDFIQIAHADGEITTLTDVATIEMGEKIEVIAHADTVTKDAPANTDKTEKTDGPTVKDVWDSMSDEQRQLTEYLVDTALDEPEPNPADDTAAHSNLNNNTEGAQQMRRNMFDKTLQGGNGNGNGKEPTHISHANMIAIRDEADENSGLYSKVFLAHAATYGIENIEVLFPDATTLPDQPSVISRRMEWVPQVVDAARHSPFSRVKMLHVDITADEARARGYVKATLKKEEVVKMMKRVTQPTTIYKKQKLDRDDVVDITSFDVIAWMKGEMQVMLKEELGRAILIGDGREPDDDDKIDEDCIRPIAFDAELYTVQIEIPSNITGDALVEAVLRSRKRYKGTGRPTFFTVEDVITDLLLVKDNFGRRLYPTEADLAAAMRVDSLVPVEVMETIPDMLGIMVNMVDYTVGADKGGELAFFDDFDIDFNQMKYLYETRCSGSLTKPNSAIVYTRAAGTEVSPAVPQFDENTGVVTIPNTNGVQYSQDGVDVNNGNRPAIAAGTSTEIKARPKSGFHFPHNIDTDYDFTRKP